VLINIAGIAGVSGQKEDWQWSTNDLGPCIQCEHYGPLRVVSAFSDHISPQWSESVITPHEWMELARRQYVWGSIAYRQLQGAVNMVIEARRRRSIWRLARQSLVFWVTTPDGSYSPIWAPQVSVGRRIESVTFAMRTANRDVRAQINRSVSITTTARFPSHGDRSARSLKPRTPDNESRVAPGRLRGQKRSANGNVVQITCRDLAPPA